jgi:hypothetical protein
VKGFEDGKVRRKKHIMSFKLTEEEHAKYRRFFEEQQFAPTFTDLVLRGLALLYDKYNPPIMGALNGTQKVVAGTPPPGGPGIDRRASGDGGPAEEGAQQRRRPGNTAGKVRDRKPVGKKLPGGVRGGRDHSGVGSSKPRKKREKVSAK